MKQSEKRAELQRRGPRSLSRSRKWPDIRDRSMMPAIVSQQSCFKEEIVGNPWLHKYVAADNIPEEKPRSNE